MLVHQNRHTLEAREILAHHKAMDSSEWKGGSRSSCPTRPMDHARASESLAQQVNFQALASRSPRSSQRMGYTSSSREALAQLDAHVSWVCRERARSSQRMCYTSSSREGLAQLVDAHVSWVCRERGELFPGPSRAWGLAKPCTCPRARRLVKLLACGQPSFWAGRVGSSSSSALQMQMHKDALSTLHTWYIMTWRHFFTEPSLSLLRLL